MKPSSILRWACAIAPLAVLLGFAFVSAHISRDLGDLRQLFSRIDQVAFLLVLFMPTWVPLLILDKEARRTAGVRPYLAIVPSVWYCILVILPEFMWFPRTGDVIQTKVIVALSVLAVVGLLVALPILAMCARGRWRVLVVPLAIAILAGTVSVEMIAWSSRP